MSAGEPIQLCNPDLPSFRFSFHIFSNFYYYCIETIPLIARESLNCHIMSQRTINYTKSQLTILVILRVIMGWYCLYEGIAKGLNPDWSAAPYLLDSGGWFAGLFQSMTRHPNLMMVVDQLNIWGLMAIGAGLIAGFMTRTATIAGIVLLSFYYLSHPPLIGVDYALPAEGNYLWVNKTLIEIFVFAVLLVFPTSQRIGLDRLVWKKK